MSELKTKSLAELEALRTECLAKLASLRNQTAGQNVRLTWIEKYIEGKSAKELTLEEIAQALGHEVILKKG